MSYSISTKFIPSKRFNTNDIELRILVNGQIVATSRFNETPDIAKESIYEEFFETSKRVKETAKVLWIKSFYVEPKHRGNGYMHQLIRETMNYIETTLDIHEDVFIGLLVAPYRNDITNTITNEKLSNMYERYGFVQDVDDFMFKRNH